MLKKLSVAACALAFAAPAAAQGISDDAVRIGILTDMAALYSDLSGDGSVVAAELAIEDYGDTVLGKPIELLSADHQNKADIAASKANEWADVNGVDMITDLVTSSVALAVAGVGKEKGVVTMVAGAASSRLSGSDCQSTNFHWAYDTFALANGTGGAVVKNGGDTWFFLTADYAFGYSLEGDVTSVVEANGGTVVGGVRHPLQTSDFSSFLLQAQASGAKIVGLANAGGDTINSIKQANEFGIVQAGQSLAGLLVFITDVHSLGLETAQGLLLTTGWYWDRDDATRAFSERFEPRVGSKPTMVHAGVYSATLNYLRAVEAAGTDDAETVAETLRGMTVNDMFAYDGVVQPNGRMAHTMYLARVKSPEESTGPWDYYEIVREIPADEAFKNPAESGCALVN